MATERRGMAVVAAAAVPLFAMEVGVGFLRFQVRRKRGVRTFRRALQQSGMSREQAARLAQTYHEAGSLRVILRGRLGSSGDPGASEP